MTGVAWLLVILNALSHWRLYAERHPASWLAELWQVTAR